MEVLGSGLSAEKKIETVGTKSVSTLIMIKYSCALILLSIFFSNSSRAVSCQSITGQHMGIDFYIEILSESESALVALMQSNLEPDAIETLGKAYALTQELINLSLDKNLDPVSEQSAVSLKAFLDDSDSIDWKGLSRFVEPNIDVQKSEKSSSLEGLESFTEVVPGQQYIVKDTIGSEYVVSFSKKVLSDLVGPKLGIEFKRGLFKALQKGIQQADQTNGIKLMKMSDGFAFAEIKNVGRYAGKRVYGIIDGASIQFVMLADHSGSAGDAVHKRLRSIMMQHRM